MMWAARIMLQRIFTVTLVAEDTVARILIAPLSAQPIEPPLQKDAQTGWWDLRGQTLKEGFGTAGKLRSALLMKPPLSPPTGQEDLDREGAHLLPKVLPNGPLHPRATLNGPLS